MTTETYTNGYGDDALRLMTRRTLASHGAFILPLLQPGQCILDLGCGPGNLTRELAQRVAPGGSVVGVDRSGGQLPALAAEEGEAVTFHAMDAYQLAFEDASFDGVFSHALFEHVARPLDVLAEARRVLRPGGFIGLRSPDWGGMVLHPWDAAIGEALAARLALQTRNGGDVHAGRRLGPWLREAGFLDVQVSASYEIYPDTALIVEHIAGQLERDGQAGPAAVWRAWGERPGAMFAQAWFEAIGRKA